MNAQPLWLRARQNEPEPPLFLPMMKALGLMLVVTSVVVSVMIWAVERGLL